MLIDLTVINRPAAKRGCGGVTSSEAPALSTPAPLPPSLPPPIWAELQCNCTGAWLPVAVFPMSCQRDLNMVKHAAYALQQVDSRSRWRILPRSGGWPLTPISLDPPPDQRWPVVYLELGPQPS